MTHLLRILNNFLWQGALLGLLLLTGFYFTFLLKGLQFRYLGFSLKKVIEQGSQKSNQKTSGDISPFEALMTALAGAIGTGNITGIAVAVATGGFGALFWMWLIAFIAMIIAYAESVLAVKYRVKNKAGEMVGGPMQTLVRGLGSKPLAMIFAFFGIFAAVGVGALVQANSVVDAVGTIVSTKPLYGGIALALITGAVILGGIQSIGRVAGYLVPFMGLGYIGASLVVIIYHYDQLLPALSMIVHSAFTGQAAIGGFVGSTFILALKSGVANGTLANEAGLGSLSIAASSAAVKHPAEQGFFAIAGVFVSTMLICTMTGMVLAVTNVLGTLDANGEMLTGSPLAIMAFSSVQPLFSYVVTFGLILFAFTTILAWAYYGEKCTEFLMGLKAVPLFRVFYIILVVMGAVVELNFVWEFAYFSCALMAIPNIISVIGLRHVVVRETQAYLHRLKK